MISLFDVNFFGSTLLEGVLDIFQDDVFDSAMVNLPELVIAFCIEVDNSTATKLVLTFDQVTA